MVKIEFYYKSADKDKTEAMRKAIDIALFGTNVQCNFKNLPDHLILEDMILEKAVAGKNITEYPTCIIYRDDTGRQEARSAGIGDAPTAYCNGDILRGVQSDYTIRKYLRKLLGQS